jgi:hypothetical protein
MPAAFEETSSTGKTSGVRLRAVDIFQIGQLRLGFVSHPNDVGSMEKVFAERTIAFVADGDTLMIETICFVCLPIDSGTLGLERD